MIKYNNKKSVILGLFTMITALIFIAFVMERIYINLVDYELISFYDLLIFVFSNALKDPLFIVFIIFDILVIFSIRSYQLNVSISEYPKPLLNKFKSNYSEIDLKNYLKWIVILNCVLFIIIIISFLFIRELSVYMFSMALIADAYILGKYIGINLFRVNDFEQN